MDVQTHTALIGTYTDIVGNTLRTVLFGLTGTMALIVFADVSQYKLAMSVLVITLALYGVLRTNAPMMVISALADDLPTELEGSSFGQAFTGAPISVFRAIVAVLMIAVAITQLLAIW